MPEPTSWVSLIFLIAVLILVFPAVMVTFRQPTALRNVAIWVALFAALVWGYHYFVQIPEQRQNGTQERVEDQYAPDDSQINKEEGPVRRSL